MICFKLIALGYASKEAKWLRNFMYEIPVLIKPISLMAIHFDSDSALNNAYSLTYNGKSRRRSLRHSLVNDLSKGSVIFVDYVNTKINMVD